MWAIKMPRIEMSLQRWTRRRLHPYIINGESLGSRQQDIGGVFNIKTLYLSVRDRSCNFRIAISKWHTAYCTIKKFGNIDLRNLDDFYQFQYFLRHILLRFICGMVHNDVAKYNQTTAEKKYFDKQIGRTE